MDGHDPCHTFRVTAAVNKRPLSILIDTGSTHNFLDERMAARLGYPIIQIPPFSITVADGGQLSCDKKAESLTWSLQNNAFQTTFYILPLGGCDVVLGVQWLKTLGEFSMDMTTLYMKFSYNGRMHTLRGSIPKSFKRFSLKSMVKLQHSSSPLALL